MPHHCSHVCKDLCTYTWHAFKSTEQGLFLTKMDKQPTQGPDKGNDFAITYLCKSGQMYIELTRTESGDTVVGYRFSSTP